MSAKFPIYRDANTLLLQIEQAVRTFPRYHKYTIGSELRRATMELVRQLSRSIKYADQRLRWVTEAHDTLDDLKVQIQLAKELKAFHSFRQYESIAALAFGVSKQAWGWKKKLQRTSSEKGMRGLNGVQS
ncbi:MAG: four helix bundle protein [Gammaproteobacteria bacterium]|jgi:hypothetical protein|nr:four helix bundle protein [Gammaproteobacteria bacterium]MBT4812071.1 four helix bundle protein [Thiotrichales bacterium]MBT3473711.1 four helix bundle protein [Gammaproteobacteria bacterium]MBT3968159.1 four helix bundle protein [Gammaproteobacteria bacterium]MBT4079327.1 four helix bundle protein [Gammaproteobacteria bacterium]